MPCAHQVFKWSLARAGLGMTRVYENPDVSFSIHPDFHPGNLFHRSFAKWKSTILSPDWSVTTSNILSFCMHKLYFDVIFLDTWFLPVGWCHRASVPDGWELQDAIFAIDVKTCGPPKKWRSQSEKLYQSVPKIWRAVHFQKNKMSHFIDTYWLCILLQFWPCFHSEFNLGGQLLALLRQFLSELR